MCYSRGTLTRRSSTVSNNVNDELMERVEELMDYWDNTMWSRILRRDLDSNDLESLHYHVSEAYAQMAMQEDFAVVDMPDMRPTLTKSKKLISDCE